MTPASVFWYSLLRSFKSSWKTRCRLCAFCVLPPEMCSQQWKSLCIKSLRRCSGGKNCLKDTIKNMTGLVDPEGLNFTQSCLFVLMSRLCVHCIYVYIEGLAFCCYIVVIVNLYLKVEILHAFKWTFKWHPSKHFGFNWCKYSTWSDLKVPYYTVFHQYIIGLRCIQNISLKCLARNTKQIIVASHKPLCFSPVSKVLIFCLLL